MDEPKVAEVGSRGMEAAGVGSRGRRKRSAARIAFYILIYQGLMMIVGLLTIALIEAVHNLFAS